MGLSKQQRDALPPKDFALPASRQYPIPDEQHAELALEDMQAAASPKQKALIKAAIAKRFPNVSLNGKPRMSGPISNGRRK